MDSTALPNRGPGYQPDQGAGCCYRGGRPGLGYRAGDSPTIALVAVTKQQIGQFDLRQFVNQIGRSGSTVGVNSHVQRAGCRKRESASRVRDLIGRDPQVGKHAIDATEFRGSGNLHHLGKIGAAQDRTRPEFGQPVSGPGDCRGVGVKTQQTSVRAIALEDQGGVASTTYGCVEKIGIGSWVQLRERLEGHHRLVGVWNRHPHRPIGKCEAEGRRSTPH